MQAVRDRGEATASEFTSVVPALKAQLTFGEGKTWGGTQGVATRVLSMLAAEGQLVRGRPRVRGRAASTAGRRCPRGLATARTRSTRTTPRPSSRGATSAPSGRPRSPTSSGGRVGRRERSLARSPWSRRPRWKPVAAPLTCSPTTTLRPRRRVRRGRHSFRCSIRRRWAGSVAAGTSASTARRCSIDRATSGPTVWCDGRIVGGWAQRSDGTIVHRLLEKVGRAGRAAIEREQQRLTALLGEVRVTPRFRTPVERELAGG